MTLNRKIMIIVIACVLVIGLVYFAGNSYSPAGRHFLRNLARHLIRIDAPGVIIR